MKKLFHKKTLFLCLLVIQACCLIGKKQTNIPYRFIDHLEKKNIIASPYIDLHQNFKKIIQNWSGNDLRSFVISGHKSFLICSLVPILAWEEQGKPERMKISLQKKEIPFLENPDSKAWSWKLKKGEVTIDDFTINGNGKGSVSLEEGRQYEESLFLPDGEFILEIWAENDNQQKHFPTLKVELNNKPIGETSIGPYKCYEFTGSADLGWNKLSLFQDKSESDLSPQSEIIIDKIFIKSVKDFIFLNVPKKKENFSSLNFASEYLAEPIDKIIQIKKDIRPLQPHFQEIEFDSVGQKNIEIIGQTSLLDSVLIGKLDGKEIFAQKFISNCQNSFSFEMWSEKRKHNLELEYKPPSKREGHAYLYHLILTNPMKDFLLPLARMKNEFPLSNLFIKKNPLNLKKKLVYPGFAKRIKRHTTDTALDIISAPPLTRLEFKLRIPPSSVLEFGYGIYKKIFEDIGETVNFKVLILDKAKESVLFSKSLNPPDDKSINIILEKKIDLSSFSNRKVTIKFITESSVPKSSKSKVQTSQGMESAYWFNPVIYIPSQNRTRKEADFNIILISLDTLRADHLKCYGYDKETSPSLDQLSADSVLFTNAYSTTSWTLPAHISLLTSLDTRHHLVNKMNPFLNTSIVSLAELLRKNGYFTYAFTGSALVSSQFGFSKGFDFFHELKNSQVFRNSAGTLFHQFDNWIRKNNDKKFFIFLHTYQPHEPYFSPEPFNSFFLDQKTIHWRKGDMDRILFKDQLREERIFMEITPAEKENIIALYDGEIRYTDFHLINPIITKLKRLNLYDKTMIIITSDHGEEFYDHNAWLHGHSLYNELIKIPLLIKFPLSKFKNKRWKKIVRITDIMPTILEEAGVDYSSYKIDGESLINPLMKNDGFNRMFVADVSSGNYPFELPARITMNSDKFKLILNNDFGHPPEFYLPPPPPIAKVELYDLENDPLENRNIALQKQELVQKMLKALLRAYPLKRGKADEKGMQKELERTLKALGYIGKN